MGDLGTLFGSGQRQSQTTTPDANAQALNFLRKDQLQYLFGQSPYASFAGANPGGAYVPGQGTLDLIQGATGEYAAGGGPADTSDLLSLDEYIKLGLDQAQNYITQIASPEILSQAALSGLESGGAPQEALAKATAQIGLPFVQGLPQASSTLTLTPQQANLTKAQAGATRTGQATSLFPLADFGRSLQAEDVNRRQGILTSGLTGLPFSPGQSTKGSTNQQPLFNFFGQG